VYSEEAKETDLEVKDKKTTLQLDIQNLTNEKIREVHRCFNSILGNREKVSHELLKRLL
jgi:hypothetical protein